MKKAAITIGLFIWFTTLAMLGATASAEDAPTPKNGIPVVFVKVDETGDNPTIAQMNDDEEHETRCVGTVRIITPEGFTSEYGGSAPTEEIQLEYIRGRGNSSWMSVKKPYKIKFAKEDEEQTVPLTGKQNLFGMGKSREWALMANAYDPTLMKNYITSWLGQQIGMPYTPQMIPVDLYMEGTGTEREYLGTYCLSEIVMIEKSRVNIDELSEDEETDVTGGYLIPFFTDFQNSDEPLNTRIKTKAGVELFSKEPSFGEDLTAGQEAQRAYINQYIQDLEDLIMTPKEEFTEETHNQIAALMDLDSAADYWLIQEFSDNADAFDTSSTYLYKEKDGKLCWGPLWDFDYAWGSQSDEYDPEAKPNIGLNHTTMIWIDELRKKDPWFDQTIEDHWDHLSDALKELTDNKIDQYKELVYASQQDDHSIWSQMEEGTCDVATYEDYDTVIRNLKQYIDGRREWFDSHIDTVGREYFTATFMVGDQVLATVQVKPGMTVYPENLPEAPVREGYLFDTWVEKESKKIYEVCPLNEDSVFVAKYVNNDDPGLPTGLYFPVPNLWKPIEEEPVFGQVAMVHPIDALSHIVRYSVSDESVASVNNMGMLELHKVGETVVTAELYNGMTTSYVLHVYDPEETPVVDLTGVELDEPNMVMKPGQTKQVQYTFLPKNQPVKVDYVMFQTEDEEIIYVSDEGVVTAQSPGTATVRMLVHIIEDSDDEETTPYETTFTVTVTDESDEPDDPVTPDEPDDPVTPDEPEKATYTIKYDLNGGTLDGKTGVITEQHKEGEVITVKNAPKRTGYKFEYWEGSKLYPGDKYTVTEDHTLKAVWSKNTASGTGSSTTSSGKTSGTSSGTSARKTAASTKTGDRSEFRIWYLLMILSAVIMLGVLAGGKKRRA